MGLRALYSLSARIDIRRRTLTSKDGPRPRTERVKLYLRKCHGRLCG